MNTREIALIIVFAALAIALNPIAVPAVFLQGWGFRFWEIPIAMACLLFGLKIGVTVAVLHTLAELTIFPSPVGILGPPTALLGTLVMLIGLYSAAKLVSRRPRVEDPRAKPGLYYTALGTLARLLFSPVAAFLLYGLLLPVVGVSFPTAAILALIPLVLLFDLILSLYTIPLSYVVARVMNRNLKVGNQL